MAPKTETKSGAATAEHPGFVLKRDYMDPQGISSYRLGARISVPSNRISEIVRGNRSISADTALRLAEALDTTAEFWLTLQMQHDLAVARAKAKASKG